MINTLEMKPSLMLAPYIRCYRLRNLDTNNTDLVIPWYPSNDVSLTFHLRDVPRGVKNPNTGKILQGGSYGGVLGLGTQYNGEFLLKGNYEIFEILFKPNGVYKIFGIQTKDVNNDLVYADDIFGNKVKNFFYQLAEARGSVEQKTVADNYLTRLFVQNNQTSNLDIVTIVSNEILKFNGDVKIRHIAYHANMSVRTLERRFIEQVGVSPKLFVSITRFSFALRQKNLHPQKSWTEIAIEANYYDQTHLIKDFKRFTGESPSHMYKLMPFENYDGTVDG